MATALRGSGWAALLLGSVLGAALQVQQAALWASAVYAGLLAGGLALVLAGRRAAGPARAACWLLAAALAGFGQAGWRAVVQAGHALDPALDGIDLRLTGTIAGLPQAGALGWRLRLAAEQATDGQGRPVAVPGLLQLSWPAGSLGAELAGEALRPVPVLRAGQRWELTVRLRPPHGLRNPHGSDTELWLWEQGIAATGTVRTGRRDAAPVLQGGSRRHPVEQARQTVRDALQARVADGRAAGVLAALVVGDQAAIERSDWDLFRATGVAHLMSISGLHVTMFAWLAARLLGVLWRRSARACLAWPAPQAAQAGGLLLATAYALFSGWGVPAQRTLLMLALVAALRASGRRWPASLVWLAAAALVVAADPWALLQPGFWLSFVAVGVLLASDPGDAQALSGWRQRGWALLREQGVVTLALAPLTLLLFGQLALAGLAANLIAIPWVTLVVTPLAMAGALFAPAWDLAAWAVQGLVAVLGVLAASPAAVWESPAPPLWAGGAGVLGGALLVMRLPAPVRSLGLPLLLPVLLWQVPRPAPGQFDLLAADIGQGNAILVRTARHTLLADAGPRWSQEVDAGQRVLVPLLRALGERPDLLLLSHRDSDHTGGAASVLAAHPRLVVMGSLEGERLPGGAVVRPCLAGQRWSWDGVDFELLHPSPDDLAQARTPNARSCVLRVSTGEVAALLPADIEAAQEAALLVRGGALRADVVLVPHHGSRTSSRPEFVAAVRPRWALVQAGWRNRFGHPVPEVVARWQAAGARVVRSDQCGAAWWSSAAPERLRCEREAVRHYWDSPVLIDVD